MILSDKKIRELVDKNNLIENYNEKNLQAVSYDITSSNVIQVFNRVLGTINLRDKASTWFRSLPGSREAFWTSVLLRT